MAEQRPTLKRASSASATPNVSSIPFPVGPGLRRSASPSGSPNRSSPRKPVPEFPAEAEAEAEADTTPAPDTHTLNFHRRPSTTFDPVAPRPLIAPMAQPSQRGVTPTVEHRRRSSHTRQPSISLSQPTFTAPKPSILPPEPVPTRTRAPIESFASVEMLQGQREFQERRRGSEVFNKEGRYEGRGIAGQSEVPYSRRTNDPSDRVRLPKGSQRMVAGAPVLPPIDIGPSSIANQLREHDRRRSSTDAIQIQNYGEQSMSPTDTTMIPTPNFSFPRSSHPPPSPTKSAAPAYSLDDDDDSDEFLPEEKATFSDFGGSNEKLNKWRTENLGGPNAAAYGGHRPSIVALPVYPAPSGSLAKSFKWQARKAGTYLTWFTVLISQVAAVFYLYRRVADLVVVERRHPGLFVTGWIFLCVEMLVAVLVGANALWKTFTFRSKSMEPKLRLRGDKNLPAVDVFVVSSGQSDQTTFDCAIAAASMDYPAHRFRVMVLDSTSSAILERDVVKHAKTQGCPHLSYHRRTLNSNMGDVFHSKANSINFGMKEASTFGIKGPAEFIAVIDADMIPERNFLRATLPAMLPNNRVGLVRSGQGFINLPLRLNQAAATLMNASETASDNRSGFLLRRSAILEIGGFPVDSWIQDGHCDALLTGRGFEVAVVDEVLQWGMAKPTYGAQVNQMMLNRLGPLRTAFRLNFFLWGNDIKLMPVWARIKALGRALEPLLGLVILLLTVAYPFMFTYGGIIVLTPNLAALNVLLQACLIMLATSALHELVWTWSTGLSSPRRDLQVWVYVAPYAGVALLRFILPTWLGGYSRGSDVDLNVTVVPARPTLFKRMLWLVIDPHTGVVFAFATSIGVAIWRAVKDYERGTVDIHQSALTLLLTIAWPSMVWVDFVYGSLVPYTCLLFPSRLLTEPRESFLIRDNYSSIARPKHAFKTSQPFKVHHTPEFLTAFVLLGWAIACVVVGTATELFA